MRAADGEVLNSDKRAGVEGTKSSGIWKPILVAWVILAIIWIIDMSQAGFHRSAVRGLGLALGSACLAVAQMQTKKAHQIGWAIAAGLLLIAGMFLAGLVPKHR